MSPIKALAIVLIGTCPAFGFELQKNKTIVVNEIAEEVIHFAVNMFNELNLDPMALPDVEKHWEYLSISLTEGFSEGLTTLGRSSNCTLEKSEEMLKAKGGIFFERISASYNVKIDIFEFSIGTFIHALANNVEVYGEVEVSTYDTEVSIPRLEILDMDFDIRLEGLGESSPTASHLITWFVNYMKGDIIPYILDVVKPKLIDIITFYLDEILPRLQGL